MPTVWDAGESEDPEAAETQGLSVFQRLHGFRDLKCVRGFRKLSGLKRPHGIRGGRCLRGRRCFRNSRRLRSPIRPRGIRGHRRLSGPGALTQGLRQPQSPAATLGSNQPTGNHSHQFTSSHIHRQPGTGSLRMPTGNRKSQKPPTGNRESKKTAAGNRESQKLPPIRSCSRGRPSSCSSGVSLKGRRGRRSRG